MWFPLYFNNKSLLRLVSRLRSDTSNSPKVTPKKKKAKIQQRVQACGVYPQMNTPTRKLIKATC